MRSSDCCQSLYSRERYFCILIYLVRAASRSFWLHFLLRRALLTLSPTLRLQRCGLRKVPAVLIRTYVQKSISLGASATFFTWLWMVAASDLHSVLSRRSKSVVVIPDLMLRTGQSQVLLVYQNYRVCCPDTEQNNWQGLRPKSIVLGHYSGG